MDSNAIIRLNNNIEAVNPSDNSFEIMEDVKTSNSTFEMKETVNPGNISLGDVKNRHLYVMLSMTGTPLSRAIRFSRPWNKLVAAFELNDLFLFYLSGQDVYLLPKRFLSEEETEAMRALLSTKLRDRFSSRWRASSQASS